MFNVTDILTDPDFSTTFTIYREQGSWDGSGNWVVNEVQVPNVVGIILPAKFSEIETLPEGERHDTVLSLTTGTQLIFGDQQTTQSDVILWQGSFYRVAKLKYYEQVNVYRALVTLFHRVVPA